jgi:RND superfamily putative drug exporter
MSMFARLGTFCYRRRGRVVIAWLAVLLILGVIAGGVGSGFTTKFGLPNGVESKHGLDILDARFGGVGAGLSGNIVIKADAGVTDASVEGPVTAFLAQVKTVKNVVDVRSPYDKGNERQISGQGTEQGKIAYAAIDLPGGATQADAKTMADKIAKMAPKIPGVQIEYGGQVSASTTRCSSSLDIESSCTSATTSVSPSPSLSTRRDAPWRSPASPWSSRCWACSPWACSS